MTVYIICRRRPGAALQCLVPQSFPLVGAAVLHHRAAAPRRRLHLCACVRQLPVPDEGEDDAVRETSHCPLRGVQRDARVRRIILEFETKAKQSRVPSQVISRTVTSSEKQRPCAILLSDINNSSFV